MTALRLNPVRIYAVIAAAVALVAHYVPDLPTVLILGLAAAILGVGGEMVRARVTPEPKVAVRVAQAEHESRERALADIQSLVAPKAKAKPKTPARKRA